MVLASGPLITEFLSVNDATLADGDGNFSDWVEIHNPTSSPISLDGWHLTDDRNDLARWPLPDISLDGGEYLVVFASGQNADDYVDGGGNFHTNFKLDGAGEDLLLVEPDDVTYETTFLDFPEQSADISFGISIDGVTETLVTSTAPLSYRVPTAGEDVTAWTAVDFDDSGFTDEQTVAGAGMLITEIDTGDDKKFVEIQNVSAEAIDTSGWTVAINDPVGGASGVASTTWSLPASVDAAEILYRTDHAADQYWGSAIPWPLDGRGWAMIVDDAGAVQDFVVWGYTAAQIATISVDVGPHMDITVVDHWNGDGAPVGATGGVVTDPITIGPGSHLAGATGVDSAGVRLNVEPVYVQTLSAGTYDVQEISFAANNNGAGQLRAFLAVLTGGGPTYETIWASPATTPAAGDTIHTVPYAAGSQQFTLTADADVYAGSWHDGAAKVKLSNLATITNHDNSPITPSAPGQTISDFSHGGLNDRTYAYHVTVGSGSGATTALARAGMVDDDSPSDFVRSDDPTVGTQNPDSAPLFGGIVPTIAGIGFSGGDPLFEDLIQTDVAATMFGTNASLWTRFAFTSTDMTGFDELTLRVRYDDGFQAYLDGVPLTSRNAPPVLAVGSTSTVQRANSEAIEFEDIDVSHALSQLDAADHVLAVHLLNASTSDADLLLQPELLASSEGFGQFFADATPGQASTEDGFNTVADTKFSVDRGLYDAPLDVEISTATVGATIVYTLDGSPPEVDSNGQIVNGAEYIAPLAINGTTTLRALAFKQGLLASNVDTQTYLFTSDIAQQTQQATIAAGFPSSWGGRGADYGMDPDVVGPNDLFGGVYAATLADDLKTLPALSLVMDVDDMFGSAGIYSNVGNRGQAWERPVSAELFYPDGEEGFQVDAGIRIHGGASRSLSRKNNLRLLFKEQYGPTKLDYPLFGDGVDRFDTIVLRAHFNDGWGWDGAGSDPLFARDEWHRQTQAAMGHTASRGIGVHLYINGIYWGIYNPSERPDASFAAQHLGGDKTEWDSISHGGTVDGNSSAWNTMKSLAAAVNSASGAAAKWTAYQRLQGNNPDGNDDPLREDYLDVENYIDYLMLSFYSGNDDWPGNNWYAARRRGAESEGFQFFAWDSEIAMNLSSRTHLNENVINDANNGPDGAAAAYGSLRRYEEFQLAFADRVHQHFFNGGVFYVDPDNPAWDHANPERNVSAARMVDITDAVSDAVVAESARWGDQHRNPPYTRNAEWQSELDDLLSVFFPQRTGIVMGQLRAHNLYPDTDAPEFEIDGVRQHGGTVASGALLGFENPNGGEGKIWFTSDGSDPRLLGGAVNVASAMEFTGQFSLNTSGTLKARILSGGEWSALSEATFVFDQSGLRIAEVHYNPADPSEAELAVDPTFDNDDFEFIELVNVSNAPIELASVSSGGAQLVDGVQFDFSDASSSHIAPGERIVVVRDIGAFSTRYADIIDTITVAGQYESVLSNGGESLKLIGSLGDVLSKFEYEDNWFDHTDGGGYSLTVRDPSDSDADLSSEAAWRPSNLSGGSPGSADTAVDPAAVVIHELLATNDGAGWLELRNTTSEPIDIGHWNLSDAADSLRKYQFSAGTIVPADGFLLVDEATQFGVDSPDPGVFEGFALLRLGGQLFLTGGDEQGRLLGYREDQPYTATEAGVASGRYTKSTGATDFVRLKSATPGTVNDEPIVEPLTINEIMYHPFSGETEFIELLNISDTPLALDDGQDASWWLRGAIDFKFPAGLVIPAGGFVLLAQSLTDGNPTMEAAAFRAAHNVDSAVPILMYSASTHGSLGNDGEKIFLEMPVGDLPPDVHLLIDAVNYDDRLPWPLQPDGAGPSLSRFNAAGYGNDVLNWGVSTGNGTPGRHNLFEDTTPPSVPTNLVGRIESANTAAVAWTASGDAESGVDHYRIYRDGQVVGTSVVTRFTDTLQFSSTAPIRYQVSAVNGDGVESGLSATSVEFSAESADFQHGVNGYSGTRDAEIREGSPDANNGLTDTELEVDGEDGGTELSILIRWDDLSIPAGSVIVGSSVTLSVFNPGHQYDVHQVLRDWEEGQVTWNTAATNLLWATAGARGATDHGPNVGTLSGGTGDLKIDLNAAGIAMVQSWLATPASSNFGIVIANPGGATDGVDLYSREHASATQRPKFSILYTPAPTPSMPGDFNLDDAIDNADIDMLFAAITAGSTDPAFNVNGAGRVDRQDVDFLVRDILGTEYGDANLDGSVDAIDFGIWDNHKFQSSTGWASADFDGDGSTDGTDFNLWNQHGFENGPAVAASVPRTPRAPLRMDASVTVVGQVFNLSGQDEILSYGTTVNDAPALNADVHRINASLSDVVLRLYSGEALVVHTTTGERSGDSSDLFHQEDDDGSGELHVADFQSRAFNAVRYIRLTDEPRMRPQDQQHRERDALFAMLSVDTKEIDDKRR